MTGELQSHDQGRFPSFFNDLPQEALDNMEGDWAIDGDKGDISSVGRTLARIGNILYGDLEVSDHEKAEAGRILSFIKESLEDKEFINSAQVEQKDNLLKDAHKLWQEAGGEEANRLWAEVLRASREKEVEKPADPFDLLLECGDKIGSVYSETIASIDSALIVLR